MLLNNIDANVLSDEEVEQLVFSGIEDDGKKAFVGIVFGHYYFYESRIKKAIELYQSGRIKKILLMGGNKGVSNQENGIETEVEKMLPYLKKANIPTQDILVDETSNNSIENTVNAKKILEKVYPDGKIDHVLLITSAFHMKRLYATFLKYFNPYDIYTFIAVPTGVADSRIWMQYDQSWNSGRSLVQFEAKAMIQYAKEEKIANIDISFNKKRNKSVNRKIM